MNQQQIVRLPFAIDVKATLKAAQKRMCELSLVKFIEFAWHVVEPSKPYVPNWHIDMISAHLAAITDETVVDGEYYNRLLINVPPGAMKALDEDTPILTLDGWKRHGDLFPGDYVYAPDGRPIMVQAVTQDVLEDAYRVTFDDGAEIIAGSGHEWVVEREFVDKSTKWKRERRQMIVATPDLLVSAGHARADRIRVASPVYMPKRPLLIDPYLLGAWLGDGGTKTGCLYVGHQDIEHFAALGNVKMTAGSSSRGQAFYRVTVPDLQAALRARGMIGNKHVPDEYLFASHDDRLALLQGLMDTDGTAIKSGQCSFTNKNKQIADSVAYLVASIGAKPYTTERYTMLNGKRYGPHYKVEFRAPEGVTIFRMPRKQERVGYPQQERTLYRYVTSVEPVGKRVVKCIQVDGGVYLAGTSLVPTHNSLLVNVFWPAWEWGPRAMPWMRYVCASHALTLAVRDGIKMRRLITSEWYRSHWGDTVNLTKDQNQTTKFETTATGFRQACAFTGLTGVRAHRVLIDDPHSVDSAQSDAERKSDVTTFLEAIPTRLDDPIKSAIIVIMQRLHEADVSGIILDQQLGYDHIMLPMRYEPSRAYPTKLGYEDPRDDEGELFFPERFPLEVVERDERTMGPYATAGQFQQTPTPRGGGIVKPEWWKLWDRPTYPPIEYAVLSLDTAYTEKAENDPSALTVWGVFGGGVDDGLTRYVDRYGRSTEIHKSYDNPDLGPVPKLMLMYAWADRLPLHELVIKVHKVAKEMKVDKILIENKAAGHSVAQELRRLFQGQDYFVQMYDPKTLDKQARLYSVQHIFAEGMVYAPDKDWAEMVIRQVATFPKGEHDDLTDTTSMGVKHLRDIGLLTRSEERFREVEYSKQYKGKPPGPLYAV